MLKDLKAGVQALLPLGPPSPCWEDINVYSTYPTRRRSLPSLPLDLLDGGGSGEADFPKHRKSSHPDRRCFPVPVMTDGT